MTIDMLVHEFEHLFSLVYYFSLVVAFNVFLDRKYGYRSKIVFMLTYFKHALVVEIFLPKIYNLKQLLSMTIYFGDL